VPIEDPNIAAFLTRWYDLFGYNPVTVRTIVATALEHDPDLLRLLTALAPELAHAPQPRPFSRWLLRHENFPLADGANNAFRLMRLRTTVDGALWCLRPLTEAAVA
jgi:hypothetical protein